MNSKIVFTASFVIGFCLVLGFTAAASAQTRITLPSTATGPCLERFNALYEDGSISMMDAADLTVECVAADEAMLSFYEILYDRLNGTASGRPHFSSMEEIINRFENCRPITTAYCPPITEGEPTTPTPPVTERRTLVLECRGDVDHIEGRGNNRVCVCNGVTQPFEIEPYHGRTEDGERHRWERLVDVSIVYCLDPSNPAAPPIAEREASVDLTEIYARLTRIENACGEGGMRSHSPEWNELCTRFDAVLIHTTQIRNLRTEITTISGDLDALRRREDRRWARQCHRTYEVWTAMSEEAQLAIIGTPECDAVGTGTTTVVNGWRIHLDVGIGLHLVGLSAPANIVAPHGIVFAEFEALPVEHYGFYLRGFIGAGDLLDRIGQFNPEGTIGFEGVAGGSAGAVFRFSDMLALDAGLASSFGFNPGGQIGRSLHGWPWFQIGGELRLRVNPLPWLTVGATIGLAHTRSEIRRPNVDHFIGVDALGGTGTIDLAVRF